MSISLLKTTTSLCIGLMLIQPLAGFAQTDTTVPQIEGAPCAPGQKDCREIKPKNSTDSKNKTKTHEAKPGAAEPVAPEAGRTPKVKPAAEPRKVRPAPEVKPAPGANPPTASETQTQPRNTPDTTAPNAPGSDTLGFDNRGKKRRPVAAAAAPKDAHIVPSAPPIKLQAQDVRRSNQDRRERTPPQIARKDSGLTDLEKFGLVALGAVVVGAILSNGQTVVSNTGDRVVVRDRDGRYDVMHDDNALIRRPGSTVSTQHYGDGSVRSRVVQADGTVIETILDANGRVLRRSVQRPGQRPVVLYDDTRPEVDYIPARLPPRSRVAIDYSRGTNQGMLLQDFEARPQQDYGRTFSLRQVRDVPEIRSLVPQADLSTLMFESGSSALSADQAQTLAALGGAMADLIARNPSEVFLIEGHTDAVGDAAYNLALSDARAESVALALTEYFGVPPENMVTQGYGESDLMVQTGGASQANRRVVVRRITELLAPVAAN